ncbi:MAG: flagellar hook-associated protein FlgK [Candidatus Didemnitutus sp.]|nr:flagellar hook-associated protein FlgK [Candidatus Didemnitutus sp.]
MSGLYSTLSSSVKALSAHSRAIETTGKNLANVNNPSYARQRVQYGDRGTIVTAFGAQSTGLEALAIQQLRDSLLDKQVMREIALKSSFEAEQRALSRAQAGLGQTIDRTALATASGSNSSTGGLAAALDDYFNAFQSFASRPTDAGERQALFQKAGILTDRFQQTDARLSQVQSDIDIEIGNDVSDVNRLLTTIADLNAQIGRVEVANPGAAIDLRDQRQARLEDLAAKVPIEVRDATAGQIQVVLRDASNSDVVLVDRATVTGPVIFTGTGLTAGAPATAVEIASGSIRGGLNARDGAVQTLRDNLNQLARQFVISVNAAYNPSATVGEDFFNPVGLTAGTINIAAGVTATNIRAGVGAAGDNSIALAVAGVANRRFTIAGGDVIDGTLSQFYSRSVSNLGQALASVDSRVEDQSNIANLIKGQRDAISGVSLDEEMADLVRFQRAFQASSRVFSIVDELLDGVVNRLGVR